MSTVSYPHIDVRENGRAYIQGTGLKVRMLIEEHLAGVDIEQLQREYPQLSLSEIHCALAYYYDHQADIDREIGELDRAEEELRPQLENRATTEKLRQMMKKRKGQE